MRQQFRSLIRLLQSSSAPMSGAQIAENLGVSSRSVKNYAKTINEHYGRNVIQSSREGYFLNPQTISLLSSNEEDEQVPETTQERISYIIRQIALSKSSSRDLFDLADELCISYSTLKTLISKMNGIYKSFNVHFITNNDRLYISGNEEDKRKLISRIISEDIGSSIVSRDSLENYFDHIDINALTSIITSTFKKHNYYLNDFASLNLLLHLAIIIDRSLSGKDLQSGNKELKIEDENEQAFIDELFSRLENEFHFTINPYEKYEIYMLFKVNANYSLVNLENDLNRFVGEEIVELTNHYVEQISSRYMIDLSSETFKTAFALHLKNLIFRASLGRSTVNPLTSSIRINSPLVFDISVYIAMDLAVRYDLSINEDEAAFLAIHIGSELERQNMNRSKLPCILLCPSYLDIQSRILNELMMQFGNQIDIRFTVSDQVDVLKAISSVGKVSLLFSTIPLDINTGCKVVEINPLNVRSNLSYIQELIDDLLESRKTESLAVNFSDFFEKDLFISSDAYKKKDELLPYLCSLLKKKNYVSGEFYTHVCEREAAASTAFGNIAIPHSVYIDALKTSIAVAVSEEGIEWNKNTVNIVLLIAINNADRQMFRDIYESLISLCSQEPVFSRIRQCRSFAEFEQIIRSEIS